MSFRRALCVRCFEGAGLIWPSAELPPAWIVEALEVVEDREFGLVSAGELV